MYRKSQVRENEIVKNYYNFTLIDGSIMDKFDLQHLMAVFFIGGFLSIIACVLWSTPNPPDTYEQILDKCIAREHETTPCIEAYKLKKQNTNQPEVAK